MADWQNLFWDVTTLVWILLLFALAAVAFYRFRLTLAGWFMGAGFALLGLKAVVMNILNRWVLQGIPMNETSRIVQRGVSMGSELLLLTLVAVGIMLIPASLRRPHARLPDRT